jgi:hypothetical protein
MMPMTQLIPVLQQELAQLESELNTDPRYRKAMRIRELLADYAEQAQPQTGFAPPLTASARKEQASGPVVGDVGVSKKALIKREIDRLLRAEGPTRRNKILEVLISKKLMGNEKDPMAALAAYLSGFSDDFASDGQGVWRAR